ncbi:MAG: CHAD domain-containing protein [Thermoleophilia bacterium]
MAKPRRVTGLDPAGRLQPNARRVLAVRIGEVYQYDGLVADPANVTELHDMRIACKRLRYLLEIFGVAFERSLEPFLDEVKGLQDLLGDIHDCDVQIPMLERHLEWLGSRESGAARRLVDETAAKRARARRPGPATEAAFRAFRRELEVGRRADERLGVHALIGRRRRERDELYARFLDEWRRLKADRFRPRLEAALGIGDD